jgi:ankyrin repeat protein
MFEASKIMEHILFLISNKDKERDLEGLRSYFHSNQNINNYLNNEEQITPLMLAAKKGDLKLLEMLINNGADLDICDKNNRNALFHAINISVDNTEIIKKLISNRIDVNNIETLQGHSPLTYAVDKNMKSIVSILLDNNANPNCVIPSTGYSPLHLAIKKNSLDLVKMLLNKNADLMIIDNEDHSPLSLAMRLSLPEICKVLMSKIQKLSSSPDEEDNVMLLQKRRKKRSSKISYLTFLNQEKLTYSSSNKFVSDEIVIKLEELKLSSTLSNL